MERNRENLASRPPLDALARRVPIVEKLIPLRALIPGSRKQKQLSDEEIERIAAVYRQFRRVSAPEEIAGFCRVVELEDIKGHKYALPPGRYVGSENGDDDDEPFEDKFPRLLQQLFQQFDQSAELERTIRESLEGLQ